MGRFAPTWEGVPPPIPPITPLPDDPRDATHHAIGTPPSQNALGPQIHRCQARGCHPHGCTTCEQEPPRAPPGARLHVVHVRSPHSARGGVPRRHPTQVTCPRMARNIHYTLPTNTTARLVRHLTRHGNQCFITLIHHDPPVTYSRVASNAAHDSHHNPTGEGGAARHRGRCATCRTTTSQPSSIISSSQTMA